jgi:hypothetical protein
MRRHLKLLGLTAILLDLSLPARAQTGPRGYVQGSPLYTAQAEGEADHRVSPPLSGTGVGVAGVGGYFVTPGDSDCDRTVSAPGLITHKAGTAPAAPALVPQTLDQDVLGEDVS